MKLLPLLMVFTVTWELIYTPISTVPYVDSKEFVLRRSKSFDSRIRMVEFIQAAPEKLFECLPFEFDEVGQCEIRNMRPRLKKESHQ